MQVIALQCRGLHHDAGIDHWSILASAFTNKSPCIAMQTNALVKADVPGVSTPYHFWIKTICDLFPQRSSFHVSVLFRLPEL